MTHLRPAGVLLVLFMFLTGLVYPLVITGAAQAFWPKQANGTLVHRADRVVGSEWIGQQFQEPRHFWGRPSATSPAPYQADASSGSNLSPFGDAFREQAAARLKAFRKAHPENGDPVPADLLTASGSGLDPHISPKAAYYQASRVAAARGIPADHVRDLIAQHVEPPSLGFIGQPRVNVLLLNLALDQESGNNPRTSGVAP